ncbi:stage V sporulation protein AA [Halonatronum saccharophilum]|uniref:stage V sporulation protein AA n=1 Tax=Halonatronum saccharophilum TaxID=150060 RepID=UPI0004832943|nr:stage V sporulation protein AA [Halonatronum saccharophilum]
MLDKGTKEEVFLRVKRVVRAEPNQRLDIKDLSEVVSEDKLKEEIEKIRVKEVVKEAGDSMIITALEIIGAIKREFPELRIEHIGEADVIIDIEKNSKKNKHQSSPPRLYVIFVSLILFLGSAMAIMNFHADVGMGPVHQRIYQMIMGVSNQEPLLLQVPYSLGIAIGMIIFFNRFYKYKIDDDPTPLEIEMYLYENKVNEFSLAQKSKRAKQIKKGKH